MRNFSSLHRGAIAITIAAATAVSLVGCGAGGAPQPTSTSTGPKAPYNVIVLGGLSAPGVLAANSATSVLAAQAGAEAINKAGGIDGRQVSVKVIDDKADPTTAVTALREAINSSTPPDMVLNSGPSTVSAATLPIISQAGILSFNIGPTATSSSPTDFPLNFDLSPGPNEYMKGFALNLKASGYKTVGILHGNSAYGTTFGTLAEQDLTNAGFKVVKNEVYDTKALDMTPQIQSIQAANPDVLVLDAYGAPLGYVLQGIQKLAWNVPVVGNNSVAATPLVATPPPAGVLGTDAVKNLTMEVFASTKYDAKATLVVEAVKVMASLGAIKSTLILAYNFDAFALVAAAAKKAGASDAKSVAKALEDSAVTASAKTAILKHYNFSSTLHSPNLDASEFTFIAPSPIENGQFH